MHKCGESQTWSCLTELKSRLENVQWEGVQEGWSWRQLGRGEATEGIRGRRFSACPGAFVARHHTRWGQSPIEEEREKDSAT